MNEIDLNPQTQKIIDNYLYKKWLNANLSLLGILIFLLGMETGILLLWLSIRDRAIEFHETNTMISLSGLALFLVVFLGYILIVQIKEWKNINGAKILSRKTVRGTPSHRPGNRYTREIYRVADTELTLLPPLKEEFLKLWLKHMNWGITISQDLLNAMEDKKKTDRELLKRNTNTSNDPDSPTESKPVNEKPPAPLEVTYLEIGKEISGVKNVFQNIVISINDKYILH